MVAVTAEVATNIPVGETLPLAQRIDTEIAIFSGQLPGPNGLIHNKAHLIAASMDRQSISADDIAAVVMAERLRLESYARIFQSLPQDEGFVLLTAPVSEREKQALEDSAEMLHQYRFVPGYCDYSGKVTMSAIISTTPPLEVRDVTNPNGSVTRVSKFKGERVYTGYQRLNGHL